MPRSFHILFLFVATILAGLTVEIMIPNPAMAQEPWSLPQWTAKEMTVKPGTCMAQYDGLTAEAEIMKGGWSSSSDRDDAKEEARERVCSQYTRNKGWSRPSQCYDDGKARDNGTPFVYRDGLGEHYHYYCYCLVEAVVECVDKGDTDQTPARSTSKPKSSVADETNDLLATRGEMRMVAELGETLASILLTAEKLQHPNFSGPLRSGTHYVSFSSRADELYENGMRVYAKPSHTEEETIEALTSFEACIVTDPNHVPCLWELGWVYYGINHRGATIILWRWVKQIDPNHEEVDEWLEKL